MLTLDPKATGWAALIKGGGSVERGIIVSCSAPGNSVPKWEARHGHILGMINDVKFAVNTPHLV